MPNELYLAAIKELYDGEVVGEAIFLALLAVARCEREKYHFEMLLKLESETKERLQPLLSHYGVSITEDANLDVVADFLQSFLATDWQNFVKGLIDFINVTVNRYEAIAALGPACDRPILQGMVVHEQSILRWAELEADGPSEASLEMLIAQLSNPLPRLAQSLAAAH